MMDTTTAEAEQRTTPRSHGRNSSLDVALEVACGLFTGSVLLEHYPVPNALAQPQPMTGELPDRYRPEADVPNHVHLHLRQLAT